MFLDMSGTSSGSFVNVREQRGSVLNTPTNQMWNFIYRNNGSFHIESSRNDRVIGLEGNRTAMRDANNNADRRWEIIVAGTVTYNAGFNGGTWQSRNSASLFEGAAIDLSPTATRPGWEFVGWNTDRNAQTGLTSLQMPNTNITLYAIFRQQGVVNFIDFDGENIITRSVAWNAHNNIDGLTVIAPAQNAPADFTPRGWTNLTIGDVEPIVPPEGGPVSIATAYFGLYSRPVTITFDSDGGHFMPGSQTGTQFLNSYDFGSPVNPIFTLPPAPERHTFTFAGWSDGVNLHPAEANVAFGEDATLVAIWGEIRVEGIELSMDYLVIGERETTTLEAFISPVNATNLAFVWTSSDENIVTVDQDGTVRALREGYATISATTEDGGFIATVDVTVLFVPIPVQSVSLSHSNADIIIGDSLQVSTFVSPTNATERRVTWSSSNPAVATVDQNGFVQSHSVGTVQITATTVQGGHRATSFVTVQPISVLGITVLPSEVMLTAGQSTQLNATVSPESATNPGLSWHSSDNNIATVDSNGHVTAHRVGIAHIFAITHDGGHQAVSVVTAVPIPVESIDLSGERFEIEVNQRVLIHSDVQPHNATNRTLTWHSSNSAIAQVDANGSVLGLGFGTVSITVVANDGSGVMAQATVVVRPPSTPPSQGGNNGMPGAPAELSAPPISDSSTRPPIPQNVGSAQDSLWNDIRAFVYRYAPFLNYVPVTAVVLLAVDPRNPNSYLSVWETNIAVGEQLQFRAYVQPTNASNRRVRWQTSANPNIISNNDGLVTGLRAGYARIDAWAECHMSFEFDTVSLHVGQPVTGISMPATASVVAGQTTTLTPTITPASATNRAVIWTTNNGAVATVTNGVVRGVNPGTANITATTVDGGFSATTRVTVTGSNVPVAGVNVISGGRTLTNQNPLLLFAGATANVSVSVQPNNATNQNFTWSANPNNTIATRNGNSFSGVSQGITSATVRTADGNRQTSFRVVVATRLPQPQTRGIRNAQYMHAGPGTTFDRIAWLSANQQVVVYAVLGNYYLVVDGARAGFVPRASVAEITGSTRQVELRNHNNRWGALQGSALSPNGFAVGATFTYSFEIFSNYRGHHLYRYSAATGLQRMNVPSSRSVGPLGHANDAALVNASNGNTYLFVTVYTTSGTTNPVIPAIVQLQINNNDNTYWEVARFPIANPNLYKTGISVISHGNGSIQALLRRGNTFFTYFIPYNLPRGRVINPVQRFTVNQGNYPTQGNNWTRNGHHLENNRLYFPLWGNDANPNESVVLVYNVSTNALTNNFAINPLSLPHNGDPWRLRGERMEIEGLGFRGNVMWFLWDRGTSANAEIHTAIRRP